MDAYHNHGFGENITSYHSSEQSYRNNLSAFIQSYRWNAFGTITFRKPKKDSIYWGNQIWTTLYVRFPMERIFLISEPHTTGFLHYHGLFKYFGNRFSDELVSGLQSEEIEEECFNRFGISQITPIRMLEDTSSYLTKYVTKAVDCPSIDYYFYGDWRNGRGS